jgi:hypothetical protein
MTAANVHGSGPVASSPTSADTISTISTMANDPTAFGPAGDPQRHLTLGELEDRLARLPAAPRDCGQIVLVVRRHPDKTREPLDRVALGPGLGVPGDAWGRQASPDAEAELTVMEAPVAELIANGQPLSLFGDNLFVRLDLSGENLPLGTRLRVGSAVLEVTAKPHDGCRKFAARFGHDALRLVWKPDLRSRNLRGIYMRVVEAGTVDRGARVEVLSRPLRVEG